MSHIKILDCTLRDGGYVVDTIFGDDVIRGIIKKLCEAGVDIIECGFLKNGNHLTGSSTFQFIEEILPLLPKESYPKTSIVAMVDYGRYDLKNLSPYNGTGVEAIRDCFFKKDRYAAIEYAKDIIAKGYKVYIQPVDILGYTDVELLELIDLANNISPYAFSVVDTFGSMYQDDLSRLFSLINHNLNSDIILGFHSHNNLQLSFSLAQEFTKISLGQRNIIIDTSIAGLGRGAGNTCTELMADYINKKWHHNYDISKILDIIDIYFPSIMKKHKWGYSIPYFIAGMYSSHVHNITYLLDRHNIDFKDMRAIIESIEPSVRKRYDYDNLENLYIDYFNRRINDNKQQKYIFDTFSSKNILLIAPGKCLDQYKNEVMQYMKKENTLSISINSIFPYETPDFLFFSNKRRYNGYYENNTEFDDIPRIITSNIKKEPNSNEYIINYDSVIKHGWKYFDNSTILLLRLLLTIPVNHIYIAGMDGYTKEDNYSNEYKYLYPNFSLDELELVNQDIENMLKDMSLSLKTIGVNFITPSRFSHILD